MMTMIQQTVELFAKLIKMVAPPPQMTVSEWADKFRFIPSEYGAEPGKWDTSRAPYQREIMDAFTAKGVHKVVAMIAAQLGKSEILFNVLGRFIHLDPCPILMVQPSLGDSEDWSKERLTPTINETPVLAERIHESKSRDSNNTILKKIFPGGYLAMVGANAPSGLAKRSIRVLVFDEVDRFEKSAGTEGDPVDLGIKRTSNFWNYIIGLFSTPTDLLSRIFSEYMLGTQEEWRHKCPNCGELYWVTIWNMRYDYEEFEVDGKKSYRVDAVYWRCPDCGKEFTEQQMKAAKQQYITLNPNITEVRSFHVNSFASPWLSWCKIIGEYLVAKDKPEQLKTFVNTRLAELYKPTGEIKNMDALLRRRETYEAELSAGVLLLTAAVDTQDNRFEYEIAGWGRGEERWGIKKGVILGKPDQKATWDLLDIQLERIYRFANGKGLCVARTFIDSGGHYTDDVYQYCSKNMHKQRFAIKGHQLFGVPLIYKLGKADGYPNLPLLLLGVNDGKQYILQRLAEVKAPGPCFMHFPNDDARGYDVLYFKGLLSEQLEDAIVKGRVVKVWKNIAEDRRNEPLDMQIYNLACMRSISPDWSVYEKLINDQKPETEEQRPIAQQKAGKSKQKYGCIKKGVE
jgi:phage terminase large subunit GpA-like protein